MSGLMSLDEELTQLRRENARLRAERDQDQGPIRILPPENHMIAPTSLELRALLTAVQERWPGEFDVQFDKFARAFEVLGSFHRQEEPDSTHYAWHWIAVANVRLRNRGAVSLDAFLCAALAWSDIPLTRWDLRDEGFLLEFGLSEFHGRLPRDEWRRTLAGRFVEPLDRRPRRHRASPEPSILINGKRLPDPLRYQGPRYWIDF
jgi:hypothetical protein